MRHPGGRPARNGAAGSLIDRGVLLKGHRALYERSGKHSIALTCSPFAQLPVCLRDELTIPVLQRRL